MAAAQAACREGASCGGSLASGARAERTLNIQNMLVTLDVSKLSGWLNEDAPCHIKRKLGESCGATAPVGVCGSGRHEQRACRQPQLRIGV